VRHILVELCEKHIAATIERCAQIADAARIDHDSTQGTLVVGYNSAVQNVAAAIRALKDVEQ